MPEQGSSALFGKDDAAFELSFRLQPGNHVARISVEVEDSCSLWAWALAAWAGFSAVFPMISTVLSYMLFMRVGDARATVTVKDAGGSVP